jgi:thymidylate kinase
LETQQKVREVYMRFVEKGDLIRVDGDKSKEAVAEDLYGQVSGLLSTVKDFLS